MGNYLKFTFIQPSGDEQEELLAELAELPFEGFEEHDNVLIAYIPEKFYDDNCKEFVIELCHQKNWEIPVEEVIAPQNWNAQWEKDFDPVIIGNFCAIIASFHHNIPEVKYQILITPKMSFGTGHHPTTYMMVNEMQYLDFKLKKVLDYGCGTSVLAILSAKLGAASIDAIDNDHWAYENSIENVIINNVRDSIKLYEGDWSVLGNNLNYDFILANINRHVILDTMNQMSSALNKGGKLLCSGFLDNDVDLIIEAAKKEGLNFLKLSEYDQWRCLVFVKF